MYWDGFLLKFGSFIKSLVLKVLLGFSFWKTIIQLEKRKKCINNDKIKMLNEEERGRM